MHIMDKRIMDTFDYGGCLKKVDELLLEFERATYKKTGNGLKSNTGIKITNSGYNNNIVLSNVIKKIDSEEEYNYIYRKLQTIYESFCDIEKDYFKRCLLFHSVTDEQFSEIQNISIMNMRKIKRSVVFKITEGFSISIMKGDL